MRWADALKMSKTGRAVRIPKDGFTERNGEPNIILQDPKFPKAPKLFRAIEFNAWQRIKLKNADKYDDWQPSDTPLYFFDDFALEEGRSPI